MEGADRIAETQALKEDILRSLHCALPGTVVSYSGETQTAVIQPAVPGMPLLRDIPVFMPVSFTVSEGDGCLVVFADQNIDAWLSGETEGPTGWRMHSLSDGFAFVGFRRGGEL